MALNDLTEMHDETAWADGERFTERGNWAMFFSYVITGHDDDEDPDYGSETAWAVGEQTFIELSLSNQWGFIIGPIDEGQYAYDLYAAAGQNNLDNGTHVGMLIIDYDEGTLTVTYDLFDGFMLNEIHFYAGKDLPGSVAPGQLSYTAEAIDDQSYTLTLDMNGSLYIAAHAVVTGDFGD